MRRFFVEQVQNGTAVIAGEDAKHIARVLRMREGGALSICDAQGREYDAVITRVSPDEVVCALGEPHPAEAESPCRVTLFQCLPKTGKLETIVQKCTELGAYAIAPVFSERCVVVPDRDFDKKRERYARVALEAAKQSRRAAIPEILPLVAIKAVDPAAFSLFLVAYEEESAVTLKSVLRGIDPPETVGLLIGPEGGLTEAEVARLVSRGARSVSLGRRILRTETAGMAMLAQVLYEVEA